MAEEGKSILSKKAEEPKVEESKAEEPKAEEPKAEEPKAEEPKAEEPKAEEPTDLEDQSYELIISGIMQWDSETQIVWDDSRKVNKSPMTAFVASRIGKTLRQVQG